MSVFFNSMFTAKLENPKFARGILDLRRKYEEELNRIADYRSYQIISTARAIQLTEIAIEHFNNLFNELWKGLDFNEQIRILATWKEFCDMAEQGLIYSTPEMLSAARIMK